MTNTEFEKRFIAARQACIARDFSNLNGMQQQAVMATAIIITTDIHLLFFPMINQEYHIWKEMRIIMV